MNIQQSNLQQLHPTNTLSKSYQILQKMSCSWHKRAQVKKNENEEFDIELVFDKNRADFRIDLLPFSNHPDFLSSSPELQQRILSLGWLIYNRKTVDIESRIVTPSCNYILYGDVPGLESEVSQQTVSEVMVDEAYHVLLVIRACRITCEQRKLLHISFPTFDLVSNLYKEQSQHAEKWEKILIQLAASVVSEVFVSDYLDLLCGDHNIQPFNRLTVEAHRADEASHHSIFKHLAKCMYHNLNQAQKNFFTQALLKPVHWFASQELLAWQSVLQQISFPSWERMTEDCISNNAKNLMKIDYSGLIMLADELEIKDFSQRLEMMA